MGNSQSFGIKGSKMEEPEFKNKVDTILRQFSGMSYQEAEQVITYVKDKIQEDFILTEPIRSEKES